MVASVPSHGNEYMASEIMSVGPIQLEDLNLDLELNPIVNRQEEAGEKNMYGKAGICGVQSKDTYVVHMRKNESAPQTPNIELIVELFFHRALQYK